MLNGLYIPPAKFGVISPDFEDWGGGGDPYPVTIPPLWAIGTFFAGNVQLVITPYGGVTVYHAGVPYAGVYSNGVIFLNNDVSPVTQIANGISTYNQRTGQTTNYLRSSSNDNDNTGDFEPQNAGACATDLKLCSNGVSVKRNPNDNCNWFPCPGTTDNNEPDILGLPIEIPSIADTANWIRQNPLPAIAVAAGGVLLLTLILKR